MRRLSCQISYIFPFLDLLLPWHSHSYSYCSKQPAAGSRRGARGHQPQSLGLKSSRAVRRAAENVHILTISIPRKREKTDVTKQFHRSNKFAMYSIQMAATTSLDATRLLYLPRIVYGTIITHLVIYYNFLPQYQGRSLSLL